MRAIRLPKKAGENDNMVERVLYMNDCMHFDIGLGSRQYIASRL